MITIYGIKNCDTVKKARRWMDAKGLKYQFHDFRVDGISEQQVTIWAKKLGWEVLLNRRSTTWRNINDRDKSELTESKATTLMVNNPTMIKRPVVTVGNKLLVGFSEAEYATKLVP